MYVVGTRIYRLERPEPGVTAQIQDALSLQRSAAEFDERVEEVGDPLLVPDAMVLVEDGSLDPLEIEFVVPIGERRHPLLDLRRLHVGTPRL